jgi:hypothetical protein
MVTRAMLFHRRMGSLLSKSSGTSKMLYVWNAIKLGAYNQGGQADLFTTNKCIKDMMKQNEEKELGTR